MKNRLKLVIIFAAFLLPLVITFVWYYGFGAAFVRSSQANHAPLLTPIVTVTEFANAHIQPATNLEAQFNRQSLQRKWYVVHLIAKTCGSACQQSLYHTRQTRLALGKNADRVRRIFISPSRAILTHLSTNHPDSLRLLEATNGLEKQLQPIVKNRNLSQHDALLVDPLGNIMLIIPDTLAPRLLLKDLKRLLRLSRIG